MSWFFINGLTTVSAKDTPPWAPSAHTLASSTRYSDFCKSSFKVAISASVSETNSLIATTAGIPNFYGYFQRGV